MQLDEKSPIPASRLAVAAIRAGLVHGESQIGVEQAKPRQQRGRQQLDAEREKDADIGFRWDVVRQVDGNRNDSQEQLRQAPIVSEGKDDVSPITPGEQRRLGPREADESEAGAQARRGEERVAIVKAQRERDKGKEMAEKERQVFSN